jgi:site-specific DNA-methyltransferase (adenine-specific)
MKGGSPQGKKHKKKEWDKDTPPDEFWPELFRVTKNQIIFGGNYFPLPPTRCVIAWIKPQLEVHPNFSQFELAWTSFDSSAQVIKVGTAHSEGERTIHSTPKPEKLYKILLQKYAKPGDIILDTHGGSGSLARACFELEFDMIYLEKEKDYFDEAVAKTVARTNEVKLPF